MSGSGLDREPTLLEILWIEALCSVVRNNAFHFSYHHMKAKADDWTIPLT